MVRCRLWAQDVLGSMSGLAGCWRINENNLKSVACAFACAADDGVYSKGILLFPDRLIKLGQAGMSCASQTCCAIQYPIRLDRGDSILKSLLQDHSLGPLGGLRSGLTHSCFVAQHKSSWNLLPAQDYLDAIEPSCKMAYAWFAVSLLNQRRG